MHPERFENRFLSNSQESISAYRSAIAAAQDVLIKAFACQEKPYSGANPEKLAAAFAKLDPYPTTGKQLQTILNELSATILNHAVVVSHPTCVAHLHCPPLIPALAAEVLISASNQSMDSWDQSPAATLLEQRLARWLCQWFGYDSAADGVFTSGGTQSNFMGLLLARDYYAQTHLNCSVQRQGLPPQAQCFRILCSTVSHFTIRQAAALLGLGEEAVVAVETDRHNRLCPAAVERKLRELQAEDLLPVALVATAGTTDFGSIDPLPELAVLAQKHQLWLHVDAAYGGGLILSDRHRHQLAGIAAADSIAVDFHKLFYQPISCGAFLLRDRTHFHLIERHADYLNPEANEAAGVPDLVTKSVQTTRRFDALKLWVSLQALGQKGFAEIVDTTIELAQETAGLIEADAVLELANYPTINAVVFRYCPPHTQAINLNQINHRIRTSLMQSGEAVIAQTQIAQQVYLKLTLLNPRTTRAQITAILNEVKRLGNCMKSV